MEDAEGQHPTTMHPTALRYPIEDAEEQNVPKGPPRPLDVDERSAWQCHLEDCQLDAQQNVLLDVLALTQQDGFEGLDAQVQCNRQHHATCVLPWCVGGA